MKPFLVACSLFLTSATIANAQTQVGQITGKVTDSSSAPLPGVTVTVTSPARLQPATAITSEAGTYQFPGLAIGTYSVRFELQGFRTFVRENVTIEIGFTAQINAQLDVASVNESIEVTAASPVVDLKSTAQGAYFDQERLQALPTSRDQFDIIHQAPSIAANLQNVGGSTSGLQTRFVSLGAEPEQTKWVMDGVDLAPAGAANGWFTDFDSIQEVALTTSGGDVTIQSSGASVNMVTKSGSDLFHGSGRYFIGDQRLESTNITDAMRRERAFAGNPLQHSTDYGFELGGPIKKGRAWFWGGYGRQAVTLGVDGYYRQSNECAPVASDPLGHEYDDVRRCLNEDNIRLPHVYYKLSVQPFHGNQFTLTNRYDVKFEPVIGSDSLHPLAATRRLGAFIDTARSLGGRVGTRFWNAGWPPVWKFADQHIISDRWLVDVGYSHFTKFNVFALHDDSLVGVQPEFEITTGKWDRSFNYSTIFQPNNQIQLTTNYFLPAHLGGDHSFKAGFLYERNESAPGAGYGGDAVARFNSAANTPDFTTPFSAFFYRKQITDAFFYQHSAYVQDTYTRNRLTLNVGLRWDRQRDAQAQSHVPASPFQGQMTMTGTTFDFLPAVEFPGIQGGPVWNTFAPRVGVTYDLAGNGKTVVRGGYNQYFDQRGIGQLSATLNTIGLSFVEFPWQDLNNDKFVQANEVNTTTVRSFGGQYNPADPAQTVSPNQIDPKISAPRTDEFVAGISREVAANFGVSVDYVWRKYTNFIQTRTLGLTSADYSPATFTPAANACPAAARCEAVTYFAPNIPLPAAVVITNQPDAYRRFQGVQAVLRRRYAQRWMMNASYAYSDVPIFFTSANAYVDPTNIAQQNGAQYAPLANSLANLNAKWIVRASGLYRLAWHEIGLAAVYDARQGYPFEPTINVATRPNRAGGVAVLLDPVGNVRLPNFQNFDFRLDKSFTSGSVKFQPTVDIFNLFNVNTALAKQPNQNAANANQVSMMMAPRTARFGLNITW